MKKSYEQCLEEQVEQLELNLDDCVEAHGEKVSACVDYLSIIDIYTSRIRGASTVEEAKEWADRMITHALEVK